MNEALHKIVDDMKQTAEKEPFAISPYNPVFDPKMGRKVAIDGEILEVVFTLDQYPMAPHHVWHLSVKGKISNANLKELVQAFYPTGDIFEIPNEELVKMGLSAEQIGNQRQFCQIKA
jgi:hypothetical protein